MENSPAPLLRRRPADPAAARPRLDDDQRRAVESTADVVTVLGAPGTGKSTVAVESVVRAVQAGAVTASQCVILTSSRLAAAGLRDAVTAGVGSTSTEPLARTHQSLGFGLLRQEAALRGRPTPRLLTGPEQDVILRELLDGHASGAAPAPAWPERVIEALPTRGFRAELRDLLMRAVEHGLEPHDLRALAEQHDRPEWGAAAEVLAEYDEVTAMSAPGAYDPAWILTAAADLIEDDAEAFDRVAATIRLVVVDDAQELTHPAARLLRVLHRAGARLVLIGDPDVAVQTFRGADPRLMLGSWGRPGARVEEYGLGHGHRLPPALARVAGDVTARIGALGAGHQRNAAAVTGGGDGEVSAHVLRSAAAEAGFIAEQLRRAHLMHGVPWSQMAVITRGRGRTATLRRVLTAQSVPLTAPSTDVPVRDEVAVRPLLALMRIVIDLARGRQAEISVEALVDILTSPIGGADSVRLRRLRRTLRREELAAGGGRSSDELLTEYVRDPERLAHLGHEVAPLLRVAQIIEAGLAAARVTDDGRWAAGVTAETLLWELWQAAGLAPAWREAALAGGATGARADRDLDAVVALFDAAGRYVDRLPHQGPEAFLDTVTGQDVAADTLSARSVAGDAVALLTPQSAAGGQWRIVVVAGVQEGVWPDLRLRGSLLGSEHLADIVTGREGGIRSAQAQVRHDETRLLHVAVTRATQRLMVTAIRTEEDQPSPYLDIIDPRDDDTTAREFTPLASPLDLTGVVAQLRHDVLVPGAQRDRAVALLTRLAAEGVPGADPVQWWALRPLSDDRPLRADGEPVRVSPSKVGAFQDCQLKWLLTTRGGAGPSVGAMEIGNLVHAIAAELGDRDAATYRAEVDRRWGQLGLRDGWVSAGKHRNAHDMVDRLAGYLAETAGQWQPVAREESMKVTVGRAVLGGSVDRLERDAQGRLRVIDYKTGGSKPTKDEVPAHAQLGAYQVAVAEGGFAAYGTVSAGAALLQLGKAANKSTTLQEQPALADADDPRWAHDLITATADGMAGASFVTAPGGTATVCTMCPVKSSCPARPEGRTLTDSPKDGA